jgi:hypothetical protein
MINKTDFANILNDKPDLLLGNGFSIALSQEADFSNLSALAAEDPNVGKVLKELGSGNVENILNMFEKIEGVSEFKPIVAYLIELRKRITSALINSLVSINPNSRNDICELAVIETNRILKRFDAKFTVNFDPFLYWAILQDTGPWMNDGFSTFGEKNRLYWNSGSQVNAWWLHGSIFHFSSKVSPRDIYKVRRDKDLTLMQFSRSQIQNFGLPTAILGGTSIQKLEQIVRTDYSLSAFNTFIDRTKPLVIFGWSNSRNDKHLEFAIRNRQVYFGIYSPESVEGQHQLVMAKNNGWKCFDSSMLPFWKHKRSNYFSCECSVPEEGSTIFQ